MAGVCDEIKREGLYVKLKVIQAGRAKVCLELYHKSSGEWLMRPQLLPCKTLRIGGVTIRRERNSKAPIWFQTRDSLHVVIEQIVQDTAGESEWVVSTCNNGKEYRHVSGVGLETWELGGRSTMWSSMSNIDNPNLFRCASCNKITISRCSRCTNEWVCSKNCMRAIWPTHKSSCKAVELWRMAAADQRQPGEN